jgi:hypothetical protein
MCPDRSPPPLVDERRARAEDRACNSRSAAARWEPRTPSSCSAEVAGLEAQGQKIISFCIGQPDFPSPPNVQEAGIRAIQEGKHGYTPSAGIAPLRAGIAQYVARTRGIPVEPSDVVIGAGAKCFIGYSIQRPDRRRRRGRGPLSQSRLSDLRLARARVRRRPRPLQLHEIAGLPLRHRGPREEDHAALAAAHPELPAQPTGGMLTRKDHEEIADVVSGTTSSGSTRTRSTDACSTTGRSARSPRCRACASGRSSSDGASKTYAMTGWRIGFAVNRALAPLFTTWVTNTEACATHISQYAALEAFCGPQDEAERMRRSSTSGAT